MRVLHVSEVATGGVATLLRAFIEEQLQRGHEPSLLCPAPLGIEGCDYFPWRLERNRPRSFPEALRQFREAVRSTEPDVVHLHSFFAGVFGRTPASGVRKEVALVYQPHAWNFAAARGAVSRRALSTWERAAATKVHAIVVNCQDELDEARRHSIKSDAVVIGLPVDPRRFVPGDAEVRPLDVEALTASARTVVLCLGALCWQKGQDRLVAAWEQQPPPDAVLLLVGGSEGPYLRRQGIDMLRELAPREWDRSIFAVGHQRDVRPWLQAADVLVQPSRYEGMAVAVAEALCSGVPVVSFDVNGVREALLDGAEPPAGAVARQGDVASLMGELNKRLRSPDLRSAESAAARRRGVSLFAPDLVMQRLDQAYAVALQRAGAAGPHP